MTGSTPLPMDKPAPLARHRGVMATIADVIVASAHGRSFRIAVRGTQPRQIGFADELTRALHARGRPCRCLHSSPQPIPAGEETSPLDHADASPVALIVGRLPGPEDPDLRRIDIQLGAATGGDQMPASDRTPRHHCREADIILDYPLGDGPIIEHIAPALRLSVTGP